MGIRLMFTKMKKNPVFYVSLVGAALSLLLFVLAATNMYPGLSAWLGTLGFLVFGPLTLLKVRDY